jgi:hypothetical protein
MNPHDVMPLARVSVQGDFIHSFLVNEFIIIGTILAFVFVFVLLIIKLFTNQELANRRKINRAIFCGISLFITLAGAGIYERFSRPRLALNDHPTPLPQARALVLAIQNDFNVFVNATDQPTFRRVDTTSLRDNLAQLAGGQSGLMVYIRVGKDVRYETLSQWLTLVQNAGYRYTLISADPVGPQ